MDKIDTKELTYTINKLHEYIDSMNIVVEDFEAELGRLGAFTTEVTISGEITVTFIKDRLYVNTQSWNQLSREMRLKSFPFIRVLMKEMQKKVDELIIQAEEALK